MSANRGHQRARSRNGWRFPAKRRTYQQINFSTWRCGRLADLPAMAMQASRKPARELGCAHRGYLTGRDAGWVVVLMVRVIR